VEESLSGPFKPGELVVVTTPGGSSGDVTWKVGGSPRFELGSSYFLCLKQTKKGEWVPALLAWGVLKEEISNSGEPLLVPCREQAHVEGLLRPDGIPFEPPGLYLRDRLLGHLREVLAAKALWNAEQVQWQGGALEPPEKALPAGCAFFSSNGRPFRWKIFDSGGRVTIYADSSGDRSLPGGGFREAVQALEVWSAIPGTGLNLAFGGTKQSGIACGAGQHSVYGMIVFNDPCGDLADLENCSGVLAIGGVRTSGTHTFDGALWATCVDWMVVVNNGAGCIGRNNYRLMLAHELGHGLGFDHVDDPNALMNAGCCHPVNATDSTCARYAYPNPNPANERPQVEAGPDRQYTLGGRSAQLACSVTDDGRPFGSLSVRWRYISGPGAPEIENPDAVRTAVHFPRSGKYLFMVTANDGALIESDTVELSVSIDATESRTAVFRQGSNGYFGTVDTFVQEARPNASNAHSEQLNVDGDDPNGTGQRVEALLRFEGLFGLGPNRIPPGRRIISATLELTGTNAGAGAGVYRMIVPWSDTYTWGDFGGQGIVPGTDTELLPDARAFSLLGTEAIDVTESLQAWSDDPCSNYGWAFLPEGGDGWDFSSAEGPNPPRLTVTYSLFPRIIAVRPGDWWRYFKGTEDPPSSWNEPEADLDGRWYLGRTGIGFGDGDDRTVLEDMPGNYITVYLRKSFEAVAVDLVKRVVLQVDYDDGFVAYLNGVEAARSPSMGTEGAPVDRFTRAESHEAGTAEEFLLNPALLREGSNVLAVEVHNSDIRSRDLSFIPRLVLEYGLISSGDTWRYFKPLEGVPEGWNGLDFDDSSWETGPTGIGYGDGDDQTVLQDMQGKYLSVYVRKEFFVSEPDALEGLLFTVLYDDGVLLYLNGVEVGRANLPQGPIGPETPAQSSVESRKASFQVDSTLVRRGLNIIAASIHNASLESADLSFDISVVPLLPESAPPPCTPSFPFRRGDVDDDGRIDLADAVNLLGFLFSGGKAPSCPDSADVNDDGAIDISDAVGLLRYLFRNALLPAPGAQCGLDQTSDELGACNSAACAEVPVR